MTSVAVLAASPVAEIERTLQFAGLDHVGVDSPRAGGTLIVDATADFELAVGWLREAAGLGDPPAVLLVVNPAQLGRLPEIADTFADFVIAPFHPAEFEARLTLLDGTATAPDQAPPGSSIIAFGPLRLNPETYQASVEGRPLDLTYMEYELLRFLSAQPGIVFTRETLLNQVWGYEYYGGARTVDVHVRRLRAKLGEEHAGLIQTIRSVGYRLAEPRHDR